MGLVILQVVYIVNITISKIPKCVYCSENHSVSHCKKVTNRQSRIHILKSGHTLKTCPPKYICRK